MKLRDIAKDKCVIDLDWEEITKMLNPLKVDLCQKLFEADAMGKKVMRICFEEIITFHPPLLFDIIPFVLGVPNSENNQK